MAKTAAITCNPLTTDRWRDFEKVMGPNGGFCGCWCMYWRLPRRDFEGPARKTLKARFRDVVKKGPPPGIIADRAGEPVGWVQVGPRANTPNWNAARRLSAPLTAGDAEYPGCWAISCFVVPRSERRRGVATALLAGAVDYAKARKARCIDACPVDVSDTANPASIYHGIASMFEKAGFEEILRRRDNRPLMRLDFRS
jgi:predicted GNAT family acetyltransferase